MAVSMNGLIDAVTAGAEKYGGKAMAWGKPLGQKGMRSATAIGKQTMRNSSRRWVQFSAMAANEGYWKAYQKGLQGPMIGGAVKGAMIGAGLNTAQYLYNNSDRPSVGGAAGAAVRGGIGGGVVGGLVGGIGHFTGNPLRGRMAGAARQTTASKARQTMNLLRDVGSPARDEAEAMIAGMRAEMGARAPGGGRASAAGVNLLSGRSRAMSSAYNGTVRDNAAELARRRAALSLGGGGRGMGVPGSFDLTGGGRPGAGSLRMA